MSGFVVWLTGLPSSGKSLLARRARDALAERGVVSLILDGDEVRAALGPGVGYGQAARREFYETLAGLAALLAEQGLIVLVPATAHKREFRERARTLAPRFLEVYVATDAATCERRDPKGLWAAARAGQVRDLPGAGVDYEPPVAPAVVARGGHDDAALRRLVDLLLPASSHAYATAALH